MVTIVGQRVALKPQEPGPVGRLGDVGETPLLQRRLGLDGVARQILALDELAVQGQHQRARCLPGVFRKYVKRMRAVLARRGIGCGSLGAPSGCEVQLGESCSLALLRDEVGTDIEVIHDVEQPLLGRVSRLGAQQDPADAQVHSGLLLGRGQGVRGLLHAVVHASIDRASRLLAPAGPLVPDQPLVNGERQALAQLPARDG